MFRIQQSNKNNSTSTIPAEEPKQSGSEKTGNDIMAKNFDKVEQAISLAKIAEYIEQIARGKDAE